MKINISGSINIPYWAETISQDKHGEIWAYDCSMDDLEPHRSSHCIKEGAAWTDTDCIYDGGGIVIQDWESRKFNLKTDKVSIIDGILVKLCDIW